MNATEERVIAQQIIDAESAARSEIERISEAASILSRSSPRGERTRARSVERLKKAVERAEKLGKKTPDVAAAAARARHQLDKAEQLRWALAMSARHVARGEARKLSCALMEAEDLRQHGYIGLLNAAERFDPDKGIRFATYARWWVRASMTRALENTGRAVRIPGGAVEQLRNLRRLADQLTRQGVSFTIEDLAEEVGLDPRRARWLLSQGGAVSMEADLPSGGKVADFLEGEDERPDESIVQDESLQRLHEAFDELLDSRERFILTHHYGLGDAERRSMASIGEEIGISRERVRQIEVAALKRLKEMI